jgi:uncharacterized protein HemY
MDRRGLLLGLGVVALVAGFAIYAVVIRAKRPADEVSDHRSRSERSSSKTQESQGTSSPAGGKSTKSNAEQANDPEPGTKTVTPKPKSQVEADLQGKALHDATLLNLIQNAKVAQQRGDVQTRDAMLAGLKKQPERSKVLLQKEISSESDRSVAYALQVLLTELQ